MNTMRPSLYAVQLILVLGCSIESGYAGVAACQSAATTGIEAALSQAQSLFSLGTTASVRLDASPHEPDWDKVAQSPEIRRAVEFSLETIDHPTQLFHYHEFDMGKPGDTASVNADAMRIGHIRRRSADSDESWQSSSDLAGPGFYGATNPVDTRSYGNQLIGFVLKAGTTVLNISGDFLLPASIRKYFRKTGASVFDDQTSADAPVSFDELRHRNSDLARAIFHHYKIGAIKYSYGSTVVPGYSSASVAFNVISDNAVDWTQTIGLVSGKVDSTAQHPVGGGAPDEKTQRSIKLQCLIEDYSNVATNRRGKGLRSKSKQLTMLPSTPTANDPAASAPKGPLPCQEQGVNEATFKAWLLGLHSYKENPAGDRAPKCSRGMFYTQSGQTLNYVSRSELDAQTATEGTPSATKTILLTLPNSNQRYTLEFTCQGEGKRASCQLKSPQGVVLEEGNENTLSFTKLTLPNSGRGPQSISIDVASPGVMSLPMDCDRFH